MKFFSKTIFTGFSPNLQFRDVLISIKYLIFPWSWLYLTKGKYVEKSEDLIKDYLKIKYVKTFDSGRTALNIAIKSLGVKRGDEVIVQAYTCIVVINAIKWAGANPIFVDINNDLNMNIDDLKQKITSKTKVILIQHTMGLPADIDEIIKIARNFNIKTIEDCAHSLGAKYEGRFTGTFADIGMLSFGSDKIISCVRGGALVTNNLEYYNNIVNFHESLPESNKIKVIQHLFHNPFFYLGKKLYNILYIGKILLYIGKKFYIINRIIYASEKKGKTTNFYPAKLPNSLASLLYSQLQRIDDYNNHRHGIAEYYKANIDKRFQTINSSKHKLRVWLRFMIFVEDPSYFHKVFKQNNIILGNWYDKVIAPNYDNSEFSDLEKTCPNAFKISKHSLNFPTNIWTSVEDAKKIIKIFNNNFND